MGSRIEKEFPLFDDGDVELCLTHNPEDRLVLHSSMLSLHSSFFKASLSERWSGSEINGGEGIKWRYELVFDEDGMGVLCKQTSTIDDTRPNGNAMMLFCRKETTAPVDLSAQALSERLDIVHAHWCLFKAMYLVPFTIASFYDSKKFDEDGFEQLKAILAVGDIYDSLAPLRTPVGEIISLNITTIRSRIGRYPDTLQVASKLKIAWLFRDVMSCISAQSHLDVADEEQQLSADIAATIAQKRGAAKALLDDIDLKLLMIDMPGWSDTDSLSRQEYDRVSAFARQLIVKIVQRRRHLSYTQPTWEDCVKTYAHIIHDLDSHCTKLEELGLSTKIQRGFSDAWVDPHARFCDDVKEQVSRITKPLYKTSLFTICKWGFDSLVDVTPNPDLECINISDDELPWN
ncbi:MAG: hypothetical protein Q9169_007493 [Polycauliona sp. 2 TL-2023]